MAASRCLKFGVNCAVASDGPRGYFPKPLGKIPIDPHEITPDTSVLYDLGETRRGDALAPTYR